MTTNEYLAQLERRLRALPKNERSDAVDYYRGYFEDAGEDGTAAIERLGSPAEVAAVIVAQYATGDTPKTEKLERRGLSIVWAVILAIFAAPIGLPIAAALVVVALSLLIVVLSVLFVLGASALGLTVGGVGGFVFGVIALFYDIPLALLTAGAALTMLGIGILFAKLTAVMATRGFRSIARFIGKAIMRKDKEKERIQQ